MVTNKLLPLLTIIGLVTGCAGAMPVPSSPEPSDTPTTLPTQTRVPEIAPAGEMPETPADGATPFAPAPAEHRPPAFDDDNSLPTPVEIARADLARRLDVDVAQVEVVEVVAGKVVTGYSQCVADNLLAQRLLAQPGEVQWIRLSVKGNAHCYAALGHLVIYCPQCAAER